MIAHQRHVHFIITTFPMQKTNDDTKASRTNKLITGVFHHM